jgi:hypothetical protein
VLSHKVAEETLRLKAVANLAAFYSITTKRRKREKILSVNFLLGFTTLISLSNGYSMSKMN